MGRHVSQRNRFEEWENEYAPKSVLPEILRYTCSRRQSLCRHASEQHVLQSVVDSTQSAWPWPWPWQWLVCIRVRAWKRLPTSRRRSRKKAALWPWELWSWSWKAAVAGIKNKVRICQEYKSTRPLGLMPLHLPLCQGFFAFANFLCTYTHTYTGTRQLSRPRGLVGCRELF